MGILNKVTVEFGETSTVVSLMASGITDSSLTYHLQNAKAYGVTKEEIAAIITHATMYVGWPKRFVFHKVCPQSVLSGSRA